MQDATSHQLRDILYILNNTHQEEVLSSFNISALEHKSIKIRKMGR